MTADLRALREAYAAALSEYLGGAGETALSRAYEVGRMALVNRVPIVDLAEIHHAALTSAQVSGPAMVRAAAFLAESLSPYEMTHKGFREANARLEQVNRRLTSLNRELEAFAYSVSHDLRAPLRSIDGFSQALLEDYEGRLDAKADDYLRRVRSAAQRMGGLIEDLLLLSRVGRADIRRSRVDLSELARGVLEGLARTDAGRRVEVSIRNDLVVEADGRLLLVVLENLLGNAWKFTSKTPQPRIEVDAEVREDDTVYFVRDNGAGFDPTQAGRLFAPFRRLHHERDFPGTGVGLATVQRIVERHGGAVWAEGETGKGATIRFTLPAA